MIWIAPSEKDPNSKDLEKRLWAAADQLRANSGLTFQQYSQPVLGLIFLRFAEVLGDQGYVLTGPKKWLRSLLRRIEEP